MPLLQAVSYWQAVYIAGVAGSFATNTASWRVTINMISPRFLVITRGPAETMHFDIVLAANEALAADKVRQMRRESKVSARDKGRAPIVLSLVDIKAIASALEWKPDEDIERKFRSLCQQDLL